MKTKALAILLATATPLLAEISGDYLEVRTCDVYTGPCFANAEMGLSGKEAIMVWSIREGQWKNTALDGLKVIAVVKTEDTLGDQSYQPRTGMAVLVVDAKATSEQREALLDFARSRAGKLIGEVANVKSVDIESNLGACKGGGCATVKAGNLINISTRCLGDKDHACGNESTYYPPLTEVNGAYPAFTELATFKGTGLNVTFEATGQRSAFLASFSR
ncbi:MAG TPA: DUF1326 domain-containing protein [Candidatus Binatia bacterium]|nr:DUF1326 domain-containing protein [Candidatus Binatia bacterium]